MATKQGSRKKTAARSVRLDPKAARDLAELTGKKETVLPIEQIEDKFSDDGLQILRRIESIALRIQSYEAELEELKTEALPLLQKADVKTVEAWNGVKIGWKVNSPSRSFDSAWAIATLLKKGVGKATIEKHYSTSTPKKPASISISIPKEKKEKGKSGGDDGGEA